MPDEIPEQINTLLRLIKEAGLPSPQVVGMGDMRLGKKKKKPVKLADLTPEEQARIAAYESRAHATHKTVVEILAKLDLENQRMWGDVRENHKLYIQPSIHYYKSGLYEGNVEDTDHEEANS